MIRRFLQRSIVIVLGLAAIACCVNSLVQLHRAYEARPMPDDPAVADQLVNGDYQAQIARPAGWRRLDTSPVVALDDIALLDGSDAMRPLAAELLRQLHGCTDEEVGEHLPTLNGTKAAYRHLLRQDEGSLYVGSEPAPHDPALLFTEEPTAEALEIARAFNLTLEVAPLARESLVFFTHMDNPVDSLTLEQVRDIYAGWITNWQEVGGEDRPITAYQRSEGSHIQALMDSLVMTDRFLMEPVRRTVYIGKGARIEAVAEYVNERGAIGYATGYYWDKLYRQQNTKVLRIDGQAPTHKTVASGAYPLYKTYVSVLRGDEPANAPGRVLRDWLRTDAGRRLIEMAGYSPGTGAIQTMTGREEARPDD